MEKNFADTHNYKVSHRMKETDCGMVIKNIFEYNFSYPYITP